MLTLAILSLAAIATPTLRSEIRQDLETQLIDGQSARYIWPDRSHDKAYCGFVNAKNRLGAFTGYRLFIARKRGDRITVRINPEGRTTIPLVCDAYGYPTDAGDVR